jgi:hypothetical protein
VKILQKNISKNSDGFPLIYKNESLIIIMNYERRDNVYKFQGRFRDFAFIAAFGLGGLTSDLPLMGAAVGMMVVLYVWDMWKEKYNR